MNSRRRTPFADLRQYLTIKRKCPCNYASVDCSRRLRNMARTRGVKFGRLLPTAEGKRWPQTTPQEPPRQLRPRSKE